MFNFLASPGLQSSTVLGPTLVLVKLDFHMHDAACFLLYYVCSWYSQNNWMVTGLCNFGIPKAPC